MPDITVAIDAMGGDYGPKVTVPGAILTLKNNSNLNLILVGDQDKIQAALLEAGSSVSSRLSIVHASECVSMDEQPTIALRTKKDSSMRVALNLVYQNKADACVSAGNTGALMATARFVLKTLPGIDRPAILSPLPTIKRGKCVYMLDLGANVDCKPQHLLQFAVMGSVFVAARENKLNPTVGLLNIGEEAIKGNELVKETAPLLQNCKAIDYYGFVEGDDISAGTVDVVICDGFVGNVALKAMEGSAKLIAQFLKEALTRNVLTKLASICILPILRDFKCRIDPAQYNGASLVGLRGIVVKSHGSASIAAFRYAIEHALQEVEQSIPNRISAEVKKLLDQGSSKND